MSDEKPMESQTPSADDLTKTRKLSDIQLNEEELSQASGGITRKAGGDNPVEYLKIKLTD